MKLSAITIEAALASSATVTNLPTIRTRGPIETCLREARARLGVNGEYWCKGELHKHMRIAKLPTCNVIIADDQSSILDCVTMEYEQFDTHCTVGSFDGKKGIRRLEVDAMEIFCKSNDLRVLSIGQFSPAIAMWNDSAETSFADVDAGFERAFSYAAERGL